MNSRAEGSSVSSSIVLLFSSQYVVSNSIIGSGGVEVEVGSMVACIVEDSVREFSCTLLMCLIVHLLLLQFRGEASTKYRSTVHPNSRQLPRHNITRSTSLSTISTAKVRSVSLSCIPTIMKSRNRHLCIPCWTVQIVHVRVRRSVSKVVRNCTSGDRCPKSPCKYRELLA
jgi:hypothetical protein